MTDAVGPDGARGHVVSETGLAVRLRGDGLAGSVQLVPELHVPGTDVLRASALATWTDVLTGVLAMSVVTDRVPVTLDLAVDVVAQVHGCPRLDAVCRVVKAGRAVVVLEVVFSVEERPVALATGTFVPSPDAGHALPPFEQCVAPMGVPGGPLRVPYAERASCSREAPGTARLLRREDGLNGTRTVNGALLALACEEAVLSAAAPGTVLAGLALRYLRPVRVGPAVARAVLHGSFASVEVHDQGAGDRLAVRATVRTA